MKKFLTNSFLQQCIHIGVYNTSQFIQTQIPVEHYKEPTKIGVQAGLVRKILGNNLSIIDYNNNNNNNNSASIQ